MSYLVGWIYYVGGTYQNSTKRQGWTGYHLNVLFSILDQKYQLNP